MPVPVQEEAATAAAQARAAPKRRKAVLFIGRNFLTLLPTGSGVVFYIEDYIASGGAFHRSAAGRVAEGGVLPFPPPARIVRAKPLKYNSLRQPGNGTVTEDPL